jgi:SAM-dependent methyltransferase
VDPLGLRVACAARSIARAVVFRASGEADCCPACGCRRLFDLDVLPLRGRRVGFITGCQGCGLAFSDPPPSAGDQAHFYSAAGAWGSPRATRTAEDVRQMPSGRRHGRRRWTRLFDPIADELPVLAPPPGMDVLDFGCGSGDLLDVLQECGWTTWGIEPAVDHAFGRHRRLTEIPGEPRFDLIIANHVLEHVADPLGLLRQFAGAVRRGRYLLVAVPRLDTLPLHRDYRYVINGRAHVTAYTWPCLQGLLARAGWRPVAPPVPSTGDDRGTRMNVLSRRVDDTLPLPPSPATAARRAVRAYQATQEDRTALERLGFFRPVARRLEGEYRRARAARQMAKRARAAGVDE